MSENQLNPGYVMRPVVYEDAQAVHDLVNATLIATVNETEDTLEDLQYNWTHSGFDMTRNTRIVIDPDGKYVGYAAIYDEFNPGTPIVDVYLHPDLWGADDNIEPALLSWADERVLENAAKVPDDRRLAMRAYTYATDERYHAALRQGGLAPIRHSFRMVIDLDSPPDVPPMPEGFTLHATEPDEDWVPVVHAFIEIWHDHFGFVERPFEIDYERWKTYREKDYRPGYWLLAMDGEEIAGMSINFPSYNGDETIGYVGIVGVKRQYRRHGIALALLKRSFAQFYADGKMSAALYVDGSSLTGATRLYEAAGMHTDRTHTLFEKVLRPGFDPSTQSLETEKQA